MIIVQGITLQKLRKTPYIISIREKKYNVWRKTNEKCHWKKQIDAISKKVSKGIGALRLGKSFV